MGIDDLGIEMVLPDCQPVLGLETFLRDAGSHHFRQAVEVERVNPEPSLDFAPHALGPRLGAEETDAQAALSCVEPEAVELVHDRERIGWRRQEDVRLEVLNELHLTLGESAADRNDRSAEPFAAVVGAEAAGEQSIAIGVVNRVARCRARRRASSGP